MGMLLTYRPGYFPDGEGPKARKPRKARAKAKAEPETPPVTPDPVSPYEALTDDEVLEAYATNVAGDADSRELMITELSALDAE